MPFKPLKQPIKNKDISVSNIEKKQHSWEKIGEEWLWDILRCKNCKLEIPENLQAEPLPECKPIDLDSSKNIDSIIL